LGNDLPETDAVVLLDSLIGSTDDVILAEIFRAWNDKEIAEDEIYSIAKIMRGRMRGVRSSHKTFVDIVGTGGSKAKTFNVSTAAAFVVAGGGVPVAKHGNKAATSNSGSADVLSELGIEPTADAATAERCLNEIGICFMFAPNFHRLSPTLGKVRRSLGFPTIFNCVGPLCNPASAPHQLIGVWDRELLPKMANALRRLGTKKSWILHAESGLDEISLDGPTFVAEVADGTVRYFQITPEDFGVAINIIDHLRTNDAVSSAFIVRDVLSGIMTATSAESIVAINAAAAMYICEAANSLKTGFEMSIESIRTGNAENKLNQLADAVRK